MDSKDTPPGDKYTPAGDTTITRGTVRLPSRPLTLRRQRQRRGHRHRLSHSRRSRLPNARLYTASTQRWDYDTASEEEEEEEGVDFEYGGTSSSSSKAEGQGQGHNHKLMAVNLNDLLSELPSVEKWEQPVSSLLAEKSEVNRHTGNKVLTARPPDTSGLDDFAAAIMGLDPAEEALRKQQEDGSGGGRQRRRHRLPLRRPRPRLRPPGG